MTRKKQKSKEMLDYYTKEQLKEIINEDDGITLAHKLAETGKWHTNDEEILSLFDEDYYTVAHYLAAYNPLWQLTTLPEWLLDLAGGDNDDPLALILAENKKLITYKRKILEIENYYHTTVAHILAIVNKEWLTFDTNILALVDESENTVADELAECNPNWCYYNKNFKYFDSMHKKLLKKKKYIATRVKKNVLTIIPII